MFSFRRRRPAKSKTTARQKSTPRRPFRPFLELLEERTLLAATPTPNYVVDSTVGAHGAPPTTAFTPQQIQTGYQIDQLQSIIGTGTGQTVAIVDAYDDPKLPNSTDPKFGNGDLHAFDAQFGLPDPSFTKLNQNGGTLLPGIDPAGPGATGNWEGQEALDVEWVHAIAPGANILLFEANSPASLYTAAATAANTPGVSVVLMNFGQSEFSGQLNQDSTFTTPSGHPGVTFIASTGDKGSPGLYPAYSPNVLAVGGTTLTLNADNTYNGEVAWGNGSNSSVLGGSGGGISQFEPEPKYQLSVQSTGARTIPDVSFDADPSTGVAVFDSYNNGGATGWVQVGGTGLSAAAWAGLIAIADEGEGQLGNSSLDGPSQTLPDLYTLFQSKPADFHDIVGGSNGAFSAGVGYDEVTGLGTPIANQLVLDLLGVSANGVISITSLTPPTGLTEGSGSSTFTLATFTDPNTSETANDITATVSWGDGTKSVFHGGPNIVQLDNMGDFAVVGSHSWVDEGNLVLSLQLRDSLGFIGNDSANVSIADASLTNDPVTVPGVINQGLNNAVVAQFTDANPLGHATDFTGAVTFTLSDGSTVSASSVSITEVSSTSTDITYDVLASLNSTYTAQGTFPVSVTVLDDGGSSVAATNNVVVGPQPLIPIPETVNGVAGQGISNQLVAEFTDTNPSNVIGDYSVAVTFNLSNGSQAAGTGIGLVTVNTSSGGNTYGVFASLNTPYTQEGTFSVATFVHANTDGASVTVNSPVVIADAPLLPIPLTVSASQNQSVSNVMVAEFTDTDPSPVIGDFSAQVTFNLGLGATSTTTGTIVPVSGTTFGVVASSGSPYRGFGNLPITVLVQDQGGASVTVNSQASVAMAPATVSGTTIQATAGASFTAGIGVFFHNMGPPSPANSNNTLSINWGDGNSSAGSVVPVSQGVYNLVGTHTYGSAGTFHIGFTVTAADGAVVSGTSTAQVAAAPPTGGGGGPGGPSGSTVSSSLFLGDVGNSSSNSITVLDQELLFLLLLEYYLGIL
jgi:hypothetical protein